MLRTILLADISHVMKRLAAHTAKDGERWGSLSDANFLHGTAAHTDDDTLAEAFILFSSPILCVWGSEIKRPTLTS